MKGELAPHVQQERVGHLAEHGEGAARREFAQPFRHFVRVTAQVVAIEFLYGGGGGEHRSSSSVRYLRVEWKRSPNIATSTKKPNQKTSASAIIGVSALLRP